MPTAFEEWLPQNTEQVEGRVIFVDNSHLEQHGLVLSGTQSVEVELLKGRWKGQVERTGNHFLGKMELDRVFAPGEHALMNVSFNGDVITWVHTADHYRLRVEFILLCLFALFLIAYGGFFGFQAILSFLFTALVLWKVMIPLTLKGVDPILLSFLIVCVLSAVILLLAAGLGRKALVTLAGATAGLGISALMGFYSTYLFKVSGAVMDLAMDISSAMSEIVYHHPEISRKELFRSGNTIGRSVIGTMTTMLLLAYSGGYLAMLMLFMGQGIPNTTIITT
jgi:uncharacterized membrane protein